MACLEKIKHDVGHCTTDKGLHKSKKLVAGVGDSNKGKYKCRNGGVLTAEYALWSNVLHRVYKPRTTSAIRAYADCTVSDSFKDFQYFAEWCNNQRGFNTEGWHLDKDILIRGNKSYSEDTCCFVPHEVNKLLTNRSNFSGSCSVGVAFRKSAGKFYAQISKWGERFHLGYYLTEMEALAVYIAEKELYIKEVAEHYKPYIDSRVYEALMNWEV